MVKTKLLWSQSPADYLLIPSPRSLTVSSYEGCIDFVCITGSNDRDYVDPPILLIKDAQTGR